MKTGFWNPVPYDDDYPPPDETAIEYRGTVPTEYGNVNTKTSVNYKYNEGKYLEEINKYINATYGQHYSRNKFQATEFIIDSGHGTGFCIGNVLKYAQRYGKKGTPEDARKDLLKVIHYAIIQLHVHDQEVKNNGN